MPSEVTKVIKNSGIIPENAMDELRKWKAPTVLARDSEPATVEIEAVPHLIEKAIQEHDFVRIRETDLEVLQQYLRTQTPSRLTVEDISGGVQTVDIVYGKTHLGDYIIPWADERISDFLADCVLTLEEGGRRITLYSPREMYYGDKKVFSVWKGTVYE